MYAYQYNLSTSSCVMWVKKDENYYSKLKILSQINLVKLTNVYLLQYIHKILLLL